MGLAEHGSQASMTALATSIITSASMAVEMSVNIPRTGYADTSLAQLNHLQGLADSLHTVW